MCQLLVGLPAVNVLGVADLLPSLPIVVHVETILADAERCPSCDAGAGQGP